MLVTPVFNLRVQVVDGLVQESLAVYTRVEKGGKGSGGGQITGGGKLG